MTQVGIQTFTSSTLPISIFPSGCQSRQLYTWSRLFVSKYLKIRSLHQNWNPDRPEVSKVISVQTYLEIPTRPTRKLQLWILKSSSELTLSYYYWTLTMGKPLVLFLKLAWMLELFHKDLHRQLFSLKNAFFFSNQLLHVQSILSVPLRRKILQCVWASCFSCISRLCTKRRLFLCSDVNVSGGVSNCQTVVSGGSAEKPHSFFPASVPCPSLSRVAISENIKFFLRLKLGYFLLVWTGPIF